ncbi:hypothetical protein [Flavobacterium sp.]|uniref:hypothetical protein n=1 Tax=Flavobacterium sp. TaxID=239 RepID=UPI0011FBD3B6|nr:hypothetical protein [Flavobacterium sp.]RZJ72572.1 MAG: hypothetical protein EOO49_06580 [Flavobacterium sp.]
MSKGVARVYTDTVRQNEKVLYGVWYPGTPLKLGDYGRMDGNIFVHLGNLSEFDELKNFEIKVRKDETSDEKLFTSQKGVTYEIKPKVEATVGTVPVNASIDINFGKEEAVFVNAAGCTVDMIENKHILGQKLLEIHKKDKKRWQRNFVLITDCIIAKRGLIAVSTSSDFSLSLEAAADVPQINLASASLGLSVKSQKSSGERFITEQDFVVMIGLCKIQSNFLAFGNSFKPLAGRFNAISNEVYKDANFISTEASEDELVFRQYTNNLT